MGLNKIYNEDCLIGMNRIPDGSVDMILTDMPYGITNCEWDEMPPLDMLWGQFERVIKDNGAIVLTSCQPFTTKLIQSNLKHFRYCWYWVKNAPTGHVNSHRMPLKCVEEVCVFYKHLSVYNPQGLIKLKEPIISKRDKAGNIYQKDTLNKEHITRFTNYPWQVLDFECERGLHPTQKPVAMFEFLIRTYTNQGDTVLDTFMGSGTTKIACINSGRNYIGFETNPQHYRTAEGREPQKGMGM